jgi:biopolymer transport protein ExbD
MAVRIKRGMAVGALSFTPLIDVVFLLLIFFLVATRFAEEERQLDLDLPAASEALPATAQPDEIVVNIDADGKFFIDGAFRQLEQVEQILLRAQTNNPLTQTVVIRADKRTDWQHVATAIDLCRKVGIQQFTATTDEAQ